VLSDVSTKIGAFRSTRDAFGSPEVAMLPPSPRKARGVADTTTRAARKASAKLRSWRRDRDVGNGAALAGRTRG